MRKLNPSHFFLLSAVPLLYMMQAPASAQETLEQIVVTAQKREQNILDVPLSISVISGDELASRFSGGESILALASVAPGLYAESSGGRAAPRFYLRGLGNSDFNTAASQPVSILFDEVAMEKSPLKSFPIFDQDRVEIIRGPQGTLFGRNTTAGIVKFTSRRATEEPEGFANITAGTFGTFNVETAIGGALVENTLAARLSFLTQNRSDWIDNQFTGENDALGGFNENAGRLQLLWTPNDNFSVLLMHQRRDLDGNSSTAFRANILSTGSNDLNDNFDRETVLYDGGDNNRAEIDGSGTNLELVWDVSDYTITSITSYHEADRFSRSDVDGGFGCGFCGQPNGPGFVPFAVDTAGSATFEQFTQELRLASNLDGAFNYQVGTVYFEDSLDDDALDIADAVPPSDIGVRSNAKIDNTSFSVFGQGTFDVSDQLTLVAGMRYTDDEKDAEYDIPPTSTIFGNFKLTPITMQDDFLSWDISLAYAYDTDSQIYGRVASSFRAPTVQTRLSDDPDISSATSETIVSYEFGYKADLANKLRLNTAIFYYVIDDIQLTAVGGADNSVRLLNADEGIGYGVELDVHYVATENLTLSGGFGYNKTEINDPGLATAVCGSGLCTVVDPLDANGNAFIDGNPFQHSPEWTLNAELDYSYPLSAGNELFFYTDWKFKGPTNVFLYESVEYFFDTQFEGGLRAGYRNDVSGFVIALFGRNITDEENPMGGIDFNNNAAYVNEPRVWGLEALFHFW